MRSLGPAELKLLNRLAINPSMRQADVARELGVTRSAINQIWTRLEKEHSLTIGGSVDYGSLGLNFEAGWASAPVGSDAISKFTQWLVSNKFVSHIAESALASTLDARVYFEAILPFGDRSNWFHNQLRRFEKRPYNLSIEHSLVSNVANQMNLGHFDGETWEFDDGFRFEATIDAARRFADVLPAVRTMYQSSIRKSNLETVIVASAIENNYFTTAEKVSSVFERAGLTPPPGRTLRRRLAQIRREKTQPILELNDLGLSKHIFVCLKDQSPNLSISKLLKAQSTTFPKARVVSGGGLSILRLQLPETSDWVTMSQVFSRLVDPPSEICTFIAERSHFRKRLESVIEYLTSQTKSQTSSNTNSPWR
ncbi:MAG: hypothetical protein ACXABF_08775 [Candidatus Thorarchaeota archaeon]